MSITNLIAGTNIMDLDIVDLTEDGTVVINSGGDETETNSEQIVINTQNDYAAGINWDLLEMEADHEEVKSQKESQGDSVLLLEAGSDYLLLGSSAKGLDKNGTDSLGSDIGANGDNCFSQYIVVSSNESKIGPEDDNLDLCRNVSKKSDLPLGVDENSAITDGEDKEIAEKKVGVILVGTDYKEMGKEDMQVLDKNGDLGVHRDQGVGLDLLSDVVSEIDNLEGLHENSSPNTCADNGMSLGSGEADRKLKGPCGTSVVGGSKESKSTYSANAGVNCVLKKGVNSDVTSIEDGKCFTANSEEVDHGVLNLEGVIPNRNAVCELEMNNLESDLNTSVLDTIVGANADRAENIETAALGSLLVSRSPRKRGRPRKTPGIMNTVVHNSAEGSSSREQRKRDKSWILKGTYVMYGESSQIWPKREEITGESKEASKRKGKKVKKTGDDGEAVSERNSGKKTFPEEVVQDLISAAQGLFNPKKLILGEPARGFLTSFRKSVSAGEAAIAPPPVPVLVDARDKLEDMIMSFHGSVFEEKESLIRDARGLLEKVNLMLAKNGTGGTISHTLFSL